MNELARMMEEAELRALDTKTQTYSLCFNILHILYVASKIACADAPRQICIGSDYDGLINPMKVCLDVGDLSELESALIASLR